MQKQKYSWIFHVAGCILFLSIPFFTSPGNRGNNFFVANNSAWKDFTQYALLILFFYLNYFVLIPHVYFKRRYFLYVVLLLVAMWLIAYLPQLLFNQNPPGPPPGNMDMPGPPPGGDMNRPVPPAFDKPSENFFFSRINHNVFLFLTVAFFSLLLRIRNRWQQSEKEKLTAELSYLKAQINPHFLFNSLNSIYSLALQKSDAAPEAVQKLSSMMRYVLTDANSDFVPLQKELNHIRDYIELQRLRFGNDLPLNWAITGDEKNKKIAPLILISFIENAFKYGVNAEEDAEIKIEINVYEKSLGLFVSNNMVTVNVTEEEKSGIGLENTKNRLNLLYPDAHELKITETAKQYIVNLSISLL
jgi:hypothetical protein